MDNPQDSRSYKRTPVRTQTSVIVISNDSEQKAYKTWSDDISPSGIRICAMEPIGEKEVFLSILLPGLTDRLVKGKIVREEAIDLGRMRFAYGIEFVDVCSDEEAAYCESHYSEAQSVAGSPSSV